MSRGCDIRRVSRRLLIGVAAMLLSAPFPQVVAARADEVRRGTDDVESLVPPVDRSASAAARRDLAAARIRLLRAQLSTTQIVRAAEAQMRNSDEYRALQRDAAQASARYHEIRLPMLAALQRDDHDASRRERSSGSARERLSRLTNDERMRLTSLAPAARSAAAEGKVLTQDEVVALALDPAIEAARQAMVQAYARLRQQEAVYRKAAAESEGVAMAAANVEHARSRITAATQKLEAALLTEAEAERVRQQRLASLRAGKKPERPDEPRRKPKD